MAAVRSCNVGLCPEGERQSCHFVRFTGQVKSPARMPSSSPRQSAIGFAPCGELLKASIGRPDAIRLIAKGVLDGGPVFQIAS